MLVGAVPDCTLVHKLGVSLLRCTVPDYASGEQAPLAMGIEINIIIIT